MAEPMTERFEGWAVLELMGHGKTAGYIKTVELAGHGMLRVDVPTIDRNGEEAESFDRTEYYGPSSVYSLKPVTEEFARYTARQIGKPVTAYGLESVFRGMSVSELSGFNERLTKLIESRQLTPGDPNPGFVDSRLPVDADPQHTEDDWEDE